MASVLKHLATNSISWDIGWHSATGPMSLKFKHQTFPPSRWFNKTEAACSSQMVICLSQITIRGWSQGCNWMGQISSFQSLNHAQLFATPWTAVLHATLSTNSQSLLKFLFIESVMPSNHLFLCCPLLLPPSIFHSIRVFSNESALLIRWLKYWSFSFSINPSNEYSGLISFRMDWLDLLAVQGTLQSLFQHHSSKASILRCSAFFIVQLSHPYMTTGKTIAI